MYIDACIYIYTCTYIYIYICMYTCMLTYIHAQHLTISTAKTNCTGERGGTMCTCVHVYIYMHTYIHTCTAAYHLYSKKKAVLAKEEVLCVY